jgi:predicted transcriptional regulator
MVPEEPPAVESCPRIDQLIPGGIIHRMPMTLRLTPAETEALRETARRERRSMQEVARTAIDEYVTRRARRRDEHLATIIDEDAELLRRLGEM